MGLAHGCRRTRRRRNSKKPSVDRRRVLLCAGILQNNGFLPSNIHAEPVSVKEALPKKLNRETDSEKKVPIAIHAFAYGHDRLTFRGCGRRVIFLSGTTFFNEGICASFEQRFGNLFA